MQQVGTLRANWISTAWNEQGGKWYLSGSQDKRVREVFGWIAERAALRLGHVGGPTAVFFWCDLLKRGSPNYRGDITGSSRYRNGPERRYEGGVIERVCEASADYCLKLENEDVVAATRHGIRHLQLNVESAGEPPDRKRPNKRELFVNPVLDKKGWSLLNWAQASNVDFHTVQNYLSGKTKSYKSTRKQLAESLGVDVQNLPE